MHGPENVNVILSKRAKKLPLIVAMFSLKLAAL